MDSAFVLGVGKHFFGKLLGEAKTKQTRVLIPLVFIHSLAFSLLRRTYFILAFSVVKLFCCFATFCLFLFFSSFFSLAFIEGSYYMDLA